MKKSFVLITAIFILFLSGCKKDDSALSPVNIFGFTDYNEAVANLGVYVHIFDVSEGGIYIRETEYMNTGQTIWSLGATFRDNIYADGSNGGDYYLNDNKFAYNGNNYSLDGGTPLDNDANGELIRPLYGNDNNFRLERSGENVFNMNFYIPESISLSNLSFEGNNTEINRNSGLNLTWNADENNENGVVVYLFWNGVDLNGGSIAGETHRAVRVDDTGNTTLNSDFFEGMPDGASFTIYVIRGNAQSLEAADNRVYVVHSVTEHKLSCLLND